MKRSYFTSITLFLILLLLQTISPAQAFANKRTSKWSCNENRSVEDLRAGLKKTLKNTHYTAIDIEQHTYDIHEILQSGKFILIDFSATWCKPCWNLHQAGYLEQLYEKFGTAGTNELEIFWVEATGGSVSAIKGIGDTLGDWSKDAQGNKLPYPVFSDDNMANSLDIYIGGYPTLILISPTGEYIECTEEIQDTSDNFFAFREVMSMFMTENSRPALVRYNVPHELFVGEQITLQALYHSIAPITEIQWDINQELNPSDTIQEATTIICSQEGEYNIGLTISNKNGSEHFSKTILVSKPITTFPFFCGMEDEEEMDSGWRSLDLDGDGLGFDSFRGKGLLGRIKLTLPEESFGAEGSANCLVSWGNLYPKKYQNNKFYGSKLTPDNVLISAPIEIESEAIKPLFSFFYKGFIETDQYDQIKVLVSTQGILEKENFTTELLPATTTTLSWQRAIVDLSPYKGQTVWLALVPVVKDKSGVLVDQLNVSMDGSLKTTLIEQVCQAKIYPNPANNFLVMEDISAGSSIYIFNLDGNLLHHFTATKPVEVLDIRDLESGRYIVRLSTKDGTTQVTPIIIKH